MALNLSLQPGYGGAYTSDAIPGTSGGATGADTIDTSRCSQFEVQMTSVTTPGSSTLQVQQSFDGTNWANLCSSTAIATGTVVRFSSISGPYGRIRLVVTDAAGAVVATFTIVGFPMQVSS